MKNIKKVINSCILCLRFPFLYPRNRFTGKHYNNWILRTIRQDLYKKYHVFIVEPNAYKRFLNDKSIYFLKKTTKSGWCEYWTVFWAKPLTKIIDFCNNYVLQIFHCIPTHTELDAMPIGWKKAFGIQMCKEIKKQLKKEKFLYKYRIVQIKEKFSELRWYSACSSNELEQIIEKYSEISSHICINCGKPATKYTLGYICPYCNDCFPKEYKSANTLEEAFDEGIL